VATRARHAPWLHSPASSGTSRTPSQITAVTTATPRAATYRPRPTDAPARSLIATKRPRRGVASNVLAIVPCRNSFVTRMIPSNSARIDAENATSSGIRNCNSGSRRSSDVEPPMFAAVSRPANSSVIAANPHVDRRVRSLRSSAAYRLLTLLAPLARP
jgi:hypothetical protein